MADGVDVPRVLLESVRARLSSSCSSDDDGSSRNVHLDTQYATLQGTDTPTPIH